VWTEWVWFLFQKLVAQFVYSVILWNYINYWDMKCGSRVLIWFFFVSLTALSQQSRLYRVELENYYEWRVEMKRWGCHCD